MTTRTACRGRMISSAVSRAFAPSSTRPIHVPRAADGAEECQTSAAHVDSGRPFRGNDRHAAKAGVAHDGHLDRAPDAIGAKQPHEVVRTADGLIVECDDD